MEERVAVLKRRVARLVREIERLEREQAAAASPEERRSKFMVIKGGRVAVVSIGAGILGWMREHSVQTAVAASVGTVAVAVPLGMPNDTLVAEAEIDRPGALDRLADKGINPRVFESSSIWPTPMPVPTIEPTPDTLMEVSEELVTLSVPVPIEPLVAPDPVATGEPVVTSEPEPAPEPSVEPTADPCMELKRVCIELPDKSQGGKHARK